MFDDDDARGPDDLPSGEGEGADERPAVFVTTTQAIPISVQRLEDHRAPDGVCLGAYIGERLVARCAMPGEAIDHLIRLDLFKEPVALGLFAYEENPGLQCRLFALVPTDKLAELEHADEPWKASVPSYELSRGLEDDDEADDDDEDEEGDDEDDEALPEEIELATGRQRLETVLLGHIVRFAADRKHADDLAAEAVDILQKIIGGGTLADADHKAIDDLLDSL
jgi:hypothetical protein